MKTSPTMPSQREWQHEIALFNAFCERCGRNPLTWSPRTLRWYRKQVRRCRKHDRIGSVS